MTSRLQAEEFARSSESRGNAKRTESGSVIRNDFSRFVYHDDCPLDAREIVPARIEYTMQITRILATENFGISLWYVRIDFNLNRIRLTRFTWVISDVSNATRDFWWWAETLLWSSNNLNRIPVGSARRVQPFLAWFTRASEYYEPSLK